MEVTGRFGMQMTQSEYDTDEHCKETYAHFGLAYFLANVFETGLAIAVLQLDFMSSTMEKLKREGRSTFNQEAFNAGFDAYMASQHALTLGNLIKRALALTEFPDELKHTISEVKKRRDFLAHHYFRERDIDLMSREGRNRMIAELEEAQKLFKQADMVLDEFMTPCRQKFGLTDEAIEFQLQEIRRQHSISE